ncbi:uncharacterized protein LOC105649351 isoform X2 [Jatropha curcas]|uniref:uncharacterized protein LOC105649351 isoform X2 n=1 Tax=Jatropha curcas TaxID=180498 RepID=UPI0005FAE4E2|nr:uncharacterized protein LOC105649351 isoform X2 [Jatropha curcas]
MNPQFQGTSSSPSDPPLKRKRGRPRKDESLVQVENVPAMPVADMKKNKQCVDTPGTVADEMVGQVVSGVIEGSFDAGYLLKVKVGDTDTHLRGVVFLPGRFTPISASNDIAPQAKMYRRTEMPIPFPNPPTQVPGPVPSSNQSDKQTVELQNLAPVQIQGLSSDFQSNVPVARTNQPTPSMLSLIDNLPISSTGSSLGGIVAQQQILESGLGGQSSSDMPQMEHNKVSEQDESLKEFEASITKVPAVNLETTEQSKSLPQSAPSVDIFPGTGTVNLELQIQQQAADNEFKPNQLVHDEVKSTSVENNQVPAITEPGIMSIEPRMMSSEPIGMKIWMERQVSPDKAAPPELAMKIINGNETSHLNGRPLNHADHITEADSESVPVAMTGLPVMLFNREVISSASKLATKGSSPQRIAEPQLCSSSGAVNIGEEDSASAPVTSLPFFWCG